jgi:hypothetical protein
MHSGLIRCAKAQGWRGCGTTWVTCNIDVTQNFCSKSWWEERVDADIRVRLL